MKKSQIVAIIKEAIQAEKKRPGLWANINAKRKRGEKPSHGNSNAHKDAVAAGKAIKNEAAYDSATRNELAQYIINLNNELAAAKSRGMDKEVMYLEKDIAQVKAALAAKKAVKEEETDYQAEGTAKSAEELKSHIEALSKARAQAASKGQTTLLNSYHKEISKAQKQLKKLAPKQEVLGANVNAMSEGEDTPQEWPKQISSKYNDEYLFKLLKVEPTYKDQPGRALYRVVDVATGETKGTPTFSSVERLTAYAQDLIKPQGGTQSTNLGELEVPADVKAAAKASDQATGVQNTSKRIDQQSEFAGAFQDWFSRLGYKPGKITKSMITREVIKVLDSLNYK